MVKLPVLELILKVKKIDARNLIILPGGVDIHTQLDMPFVGSFLSDNFKSRFRRCSSWRNKFYCRFYNVVKIILKGDIKITDGELLNKNCGGSFVKREVIKKCGTFL